MRPRRPLPITRGYQNGAGNAPPTAARPGQPQVREGALCTARRTRQAATTNRGPGKPHARGRGPTSQHPRPEGAGTAEAHPKGTRDARSEAEHPEPHPLRTVPIRARSGTKTTGFRPHSCRNGRGFVHIRTSVPHVSFYDHKTATTKRGEAPPQVSPPFPYRPRTSSMTDAAHSSIASAHSPTPGMLIGSPSGHRYPSPA